MKYCSVNVFDMSKAREDRAARQAELLARFGRPLVCFTLNIPGECKNSPLIEYAFDTGLSMLKRTLSVSYMEESRESTGNTAYIAADGDAESIKAAVTAIEESCTMGRLFDMDVIAQDGHKLSRSEPRSCIICGQPVMICSRSRAHGLEQLKTAAQSMIAEHLAGDMADKAYNALVDEVKVTPKPGLVDRANNGAHDDMDMPLFIMSARALKPHFERMANIASSLAQESADTVMQALQAEGIEAEKSMMKATGNVNTHRGMIYTLGLLIAGHVLSLVRDEEKDAFHYASRLALAGGGAEGESHGQKMQKLYSAKGIRGTAADGFCEAREAAENISELIGKGYGANDAGVLTLARIMRKLEDTNLLYRGGREGLEYAQSEAKRICDMPECERVEAMRQLDVGFIQRRLSPGGCADTLAAALFISRAGLTGSKRQ